MLAVPPRLGPEDPPFLIEHDPEAAEWTPDERAARADCRSRSSDGRRTRISVGSGSCPPHPWPAVAPVTCRSALSGFGCDRQPGSWTRGPR
jgi:hypothetical protein